MSSRRHLFLALALLLLAGCGEELDSSYGVSERGSINGCAVLRQVLAQRSRLRGAHLLSPRLEERDGLLIHVARDDTLPDEAACTWLSDWLAADDHRQVVVVLRSGSLTTALCRRWAEQARREADATPAQAAALREQAEILDTRATIELEESVPRTATCDLFQVRRHGGATPSALTGLGLSRVPTLMRVSGEVTHDDARALLSVTLPGRGGAGVEAATTTQAWAVAIPYGDHSRLVVVADALPLLDGAQPDPAARALLAALVDDLIGFHPAPPTLTWISNLRTQGANERTNPMLALISTPPIAWTTWHLVALLVVLALASAAWLGRREAPRDRRHDRFSRHVQALAGRLRDAGQASWCARAIARVALRHRGAVPNLPDAEAARTWVRTLARPAAAPSDPTVPRPDPRLP